MVIFRFGASVSTIFTGSPRSSTAEASSVTSTFLFATSAYARRMREALNACGVCTAHSFERSSVRVTVVPFSTNFTVSQMWQPTTAAPARFATFTVSAIVSGFTHGRAPSCTTTMRVSESTSLRPFATESWRFAPPATTARILEIPNMRASAFVATIWSLRTTTTTWSTSVQRSNARRLHARTGFGPRFRNALSVPAPIRSLFPAATMIAVTI